MVATKPARSSSPPPAEKDAIEPPRWERRKDARPQELIAAALALFTEKGFAGTRLDDVAARAGVSKGTLYLYFESKEDLFKAVVRGGIVSTISDAEAVLDQYNGPASALLRMMVERWLVVFAHSELGGIPKLIFAEARNFPELARFYHDEVIVRGKAFVQRILDYGVARGEFRAVDTRYAIEGLMGPMLLVMLWQHSLACCVAEPMDAEATIRATLDIFLNGVRNGEPLDTDADLASACALIAGQGQR